MVILNNIQGMSVDAKSKSSWKIEYLHNFVKSYDRYLPVISITQSWLKSYVSDVQVNFPGYNVYRSDRESRTRGGCLRYIHQDISFGETLTFDNKFCEAIYY